MKIYISTINYRNYPATKECLSAISAIIDQIVRVYVTDNSADQDQSKLVESEIINNPILSGRTTFIENTLNTGFGAAHNCVLKNLPRQADHWCLLLNNDVVLDPGIIDALAALEDRTRYTFISPHLIWSDVPVGYRWYGKYTGLNTAVKQPFSIRYVPAACLFVNLSKIPVPLFDEMFFMYGEDVDIYHVNNTSGASDTLLEGLSVVHQSGASSKPSSLFYEYHINRTHRILSRKLSNNYFDYLLSMITKEPFLFVRAIKRSLRYRAIRPLKGFILSYRDRPIRPA